MKKSHIILICAVVIAIVVWIVERPDRSKVENFASFQIYPGLVDKGVSSIEVKHLLSGTKLSKTNDGWMVTEVETEIQKQLNKKDGEEETAEGPPPAFQEFRADTEKVAMTIKELAALTARAMVSVNPERQGTYQVGKLAKEVVLYNASGDKIADIFIGKNGSEMFTTYLRRGGEDQVYLVGGNIGAVIPADVMSWRDKKIWSVDPDFVMGVRVGKNEKEYTISKDAGGAWYLDGSEDVRLDTAKVDNFIDKIATVTAARFAHVADKDSADFNKPGLKLEIITSNGRPRSLIVGGTDKQGYLYARSEGDDEIYLLDSNFESLIPDDGAFLFQGEGE